MLAGRSWSRRLAARSAAGDRGVARASRRAAWREQRHERHPPEHLNVKAGDRPLMEVAEECSGDGRSMNKRGAVCVCVRESVCAVHGARRGVCRWTERVKGRKERRRDNGRKVLNTAAQWWHGWRAEIIERSARTDCSPKLVATALFNRLLRHVGHSHAIRLPSHRPAQPVPNHARAARAADGRPRALAESLIASLGFPTAAASPSGSSYQRAPRGAEGGGRAAPPAHRAARAADGGEGSPTAASSGVTNGSSARASIAGSSARSSPAPTMECFRLPEATTVA